MVSDEALMQKVQQGETELLGELASRYQRQLFAFAFRILADSTASEDAFQETILRIFRKRHAYKSGAPFKPWAYQICLNICRDSLRSRSRRPESELDPDLPLADPSPGPDTLSEQATLAERVRQAVQRLPFKQREVFILHHYQHLQYAEIGEILELPVGTVKSRMFHASKFLAEQLKDLRD
jgi:RNA polymerase sigma-70 factor, ECF subfamily